jgi:16S rRNA (cytosine1402-N4)-methyltransferase
VSDITPTNPDTQELQHVSVLLAQAIDLLDIRPGRTYIDATAGAGGHLSEILKRLKEQSETAAPNSVESDHPLVIGIDRDEDNLSRLRKRLPKEQVQLFHANFTDIREVAERAGLSTINGGILADLGVSSMQIDQPERGFSFNKDGPLDMRMDKSQTLTAWDVVNTWSEEDLANIIFEYGEERYSRSIAKNIIRARPVETTLQLAHIVARSVRYSGAARKAQHKRKSKGEAGKNFDSSHPATRTFQAIRIAVNDELGSLKKFLEAAVALLEPDARLVVITFHSLEDRMVKQIFRQMALSCHCPPRQPQCTCDAKADLLIITKKPIVADSAEVLANIRSRSAKLRAGIKIG